MSHLYKKIRNIGLGIAACSLHLSYAQPVRNLTIQAAKPIAQVSPEMWGIFFEDINFAADGGIYAELVKNRSFEFSVPLMGWKEVKLNGAQGSVLIVNSGDANKANPRTARLALSGTGSYGLVNEGFRGMGVKQGEQYNFSIFAKTTSPGISAKIELLNKAGDVLGQAQIKNFDNTWQKHNVSFNCSATEAKARLQITFSGQGHIEIDNVSLFPQHTWKERPNGMRADIVQLLADLKPGFIRFPGGCIVEGRGLANRYQWKKTVGAPEDRTLIINRWNTEFAEKLTPDYFQSFGLGFYEYFQLSEDIGAAPLPILNCGMACQYNSGEVVPLNQVQPYIQDAPDLIEFANGDASSTNWGKLRAAMGHPKPFGLTMLGVGNEQWDEQYIERYKLFEQELRKKHPEIKIVSTSGPSPEGSKFDYLWKELKKLNPDLVDEHYYKPPEWFMANATRYDKYDRNGPKIFAGEYAAHSKEDVAAETKNTWISALAEAAFMTGLERNADVVKLASYAPLLAHVEAWQWRPDLIWFDNLRTVATPNYYVQKLFSTNKGTDVVAITEDGKKITGNDSLYANAVLDKNSKELIIKIVNTANTTTNCIITAEGVSLIGKAGKYQSLGGFAPLDYNTLDNPAAITPQEKDYSIKGKTISITAGPASVNVLRIKLK